jgi:threonine dehydrogenase-like Zn-dependent dehydrogenase
LVTFDKYALRRDLSVQAGARESLDPATTEAPLDFDLTYEISGSPEALNQAIELTGFGGRVVIGSWYGSKRANLDLGGRFHRSRIQLIGSQVSSLSPNLGTRWTKGRRLNTAIELLKVIKPAGYITHKFPLAEAARAYRLLDEHPEEAVQVVLVYEA